MFEFSKIFATGFSLLCLDSRLSLQSLNLFPRGFVYQNWFHIITKQSKNWFRISASCGWGANFEFVHPAQVSKHKPHKPFVSRLSRQNHALFGRGLVRRDHLDFLERRQGPKSLRRASPRSRFRMWVFCSLHWSDRLIRGHLDRATHFSGADWCVETAEMPLRDSKGLLIEKNPSGKEIHIAITSGNSKEFFYVSNSINCHAVR